MSKTPADRAIAGLSMGGGQTLNLAFSRPELFRYVAIMSGAVNAKRRADLPEAVRRRRGRQQGFKLFWVGVGKDDTLTGPGDRAFEQMLTKRGITHTNRVIEGRHEWTVWRQHLNEIATLLFK